MHTEITNLLCPECGTTVGQTVQQMGFQAGGTSIGPSSIACPNCGALIVTGQSEWSEKFPLQKLWFWLSRFLWWLAASAILTLPASWILMLLAVDAGWVRPARREMFFALIVVAGASLLGYFFVRKALVEIRESLRRTKDAESRAQPPGSGSA